MYLLPQIEISRLTCVTEKFFQTKEMHRAVRMLEKISLDILLGLRCSVTSDPTMNNFVRRSCTRVLFFLFLAISLPRRIE
jgi:hypothetical protein